MSEQPALDFEHFRKRLSERRAQLNALAETNQAASATVELDQTRVGRLSRMDALQGQAMAQATMRRRAVELAAIEAAFARIETGDFGRCTGCDLPISKPRIEHNPSVALCIACATAAEQS